MPNDNDATLLPPVEQPLAQQRVIPTTVQPPAVDPNNPPWGLGGALVVWFLSVCLIVFVPIIVLLPYAASRGITLANPDYPKQLVEFAVGDKMAIVLQVGALLPCHLITFLLVWAVVTRFGKRPFWRALGWSWSGRFGMWSCIGLGIVLFLVASLIAKLLGAGKSTQLEQIINSSLAARYLISFFAVATAPLVEEFIYRGVLYAPLQKLLGVPGAVFIVLALFTIIHVPQYWPNIGVIAAVALLSIALTLVRAFSGQLLPCVVIHLVFNGIQSVLLILEPYLERFFPTSNPTPPPTPALFHMISSIF